MISAKEAAQISAAAKALVPMLTWDEIERQIEESAGRGSECSLFLKGIGDAHKATLEGMGYVVDRRSATYTAVYFIKPGNLQTVNINPIVLNPDDTARPWTCE